MNAGERPAENNGSQPNDSEDQAPDVRQSASSNDRSTPPGNDDSLAPLIEQIMSGGGSDSRAEALDLEVFKEVAKRHRGRELTADPIGTELVEAILNSKFPALTQSQTPEARAEMTSQIALAIFEAGELDERLERFWERLCESV